MALLSQIDCKFSLTGTNLQRFKFPCECLVNAHPDCYIKYTEARKRIDGRWKIMCPQCKYLFIMPDHMSLQINLEENEDNIPITRREARRENCKVCAAISVQWIVLVRMICFLVWGYFKVFTGGFR